MKWGRDHFNAHQTLWEPELLSSMRDAQSNPCASECPGQSQGSVWYGVQRHHWLLTTSMQKSSSQNWSPNFISFTSGSKSLLKVESHFLPVLPVCKSGFVDISGDHGLKLDYMVKNYHRKQHKNCHLGYKQPTSPAPHSVFKAHFKGFALHTYYKIYIQAIIFNSRLWV